MLLFVNPLTPRVKPWVIQSFLTFDPMDRTPKGDHSLESCWAVLYCGAVFQFSNLLIFFNNTHVTLKNGGWIGFTLWNSIPITCEFNECPFQKKTMIVHFNIGGIVSKETVCCVGGKVKH